MKRKTTANGKTIFDIRNQYRRIRNQILYRGVMRRKSMIECGKITTREQYLADRDAEDERLNRIYDIAYKMVWELYPGNFRLG